MGRITYSDIVRNFRIDKDDAREWPAPGLTLRADGVFVVNPDTIGDAYEGLTPEELAELTEHRKDAGFDEAVLGLPCTPQELADFLIWAGCEDFIYDATPDFVAQLLPALHSMEPAQAYAAMVKEFDESLIGPPTRNSVLAIKSGRWSNAASPPPDSTLTKRERQIRAIEAAADANGFPRNAVPDGGKKALREYCKARHSELFGAGDSPFDGAWKEASPGRIAMAKRDTYAGR